MLLCISQATVRNHIANIYQKLGISNKTELINQLSAFDEMNSVPSIDGEAMTSSTPEYSITALVSQQRAINEVLRVISYSPGDLEAIFDVILDYALELSHSQLGIVWLTVDDGFKATGLKNVPAAFQDYIQAETLYPGPKTGLGRMAKQHRIIHIHDVRTEDLYRNGDSLRVATADLGGARSFLAIPMIHRDVLAGAFTIYRQEVNPFTDSELSLLQAFSDQAAIAVTITRLIDDREKLLGKLEDQATIIESLGLKPLIS
ncbi:MAG: GAF domain-containing protein [Gammaproteobacteria bacterium]|jgi:GAF domain-containing protein